MTKVVTLANQKGGVSKTSTAHLIALKLKQEGKKVLLVDLDPQTNLTLISGAFGKTPTLYDVFKERKTVKEAIYSGAEIDIIPGATDLVGADQEFSRTGREYILREALQPIKKLYDIIIIDCPPAVGVLTINGLTAADSVLIPCGADILAIQGFGQLYDLIGGVKKYSNKSLRISGVVITRYDSRTNLGKEFTEELDQVTKKLKVYRYETRLREGNAIKKYQAHGGNPFQTEKSSGVIQDYENFVQEFEKREGIS